MNDDRERQATIQLGDEATAFVAHPFFRRALDFLEGKCNEHLAALKRLPPETMPEIYKYKQLQWRAAEEQFELLQRYCYNMIEAGRQARQSESAEREVLAGRY